MYEPSLIDHRNWICALCRYSNSSGTQLYSSEGGWPNGTSTFVLQIGYAGLWHHLGSSYGYQAGVDMFAAPYDWRLDYDGLDQVGSPLLFEGVSLHSYS